MTEDSIVVLENEHWRVGVLPHTGASVAFGQVRHDGRWRDVLRPTADPENAGASATACYPLIPWSNRIAGGRFTFAGVTWELDRNEDDRNALHGVAMNHAWTVLERSPHRLRLSFDSQGVPPHTWPWRFSAELTYELRDDRLVVDTLLRNEAEEEVPAGFGHHPYFVRRMDGDAEEVRVRIPAAEMFELDECIPHDAPVSVEPRVDFRELRTLGGEHIDDDLTGLTDGASLIRYERLDIVHEADPLYTQRILFAPPEKDYFALEPATNANDGFNLFDRGVGGNGVFTLEPGAAASAAWSLTALPR
ncbi:aldose epimerase [Microbacterium sp. Marseille-Q6965]|uniref:aldose epimerase family protein n=1 Tax=Microbacterium sp. Marseille-Q6965 TaxID=2965072 RepID=UPI0021B821C6|nr:aldose epimerase [Microbacterium sp. Marseille-Q6965]